LPVLYYVTAHAALAVACAAVALDPRGVAGFFYHARMLGIVHLVTLGWITSSILGSMYVVGPVAMRIRFSAAWVDYAAYAAVAGGIVGMVGHFWIEEYDGMAWSAATVAAGILVAGVRIVRQLPRARVPRAVSAHIVLAFANIAGAATLGVLIGFDKVYQFLPGYVLTNVFAHAHLAAIGWASLMVVGVAYRLLPMVLPAEMPSGGTLWATAILLETGVVGLFVALLRQAPFAWVFALVVVAGFSVFLWQIAWMVRRPRPRPRALASPDPAVLHAAFSFVCLIGACALGVWLAWSPQSERTLELAMGYGVLGLVGFLAQMIVGMEGRLLPLFAWYCASANARFTGSVVSPHQMASRSLQELVFVLWLFGVPALAVGLTFTFVPFVRAAGWSLLAATLLDSINMTRILRHAFAATPAPAN
jgi:hypothetical protein